jgi:hypothetical protein
MRYCYTEAEKAEITIELTIADLQRIARKAVKAAAADGSTYRIRRSDTCNACSMKCPTDSGRSFAEDAAAPLLGGKQ